MSDKDNIRDMVMALVRGDHDAATAASAIFIPNKTATIVNEDFDEETTVDVTDLSVGDVESADDE